MTPKSADEGLAVLLSVFEDRSPDSLLQALEASDGDVQRATEALLAQDVATPPPAKRRKASGSVKSWIGRVKAPEAPAPRKTSAPSRPDKPGSPARNLNDVLRDVASEPTSQQAAAALPPLLLSSPEMVAAHLPCSLVLDILPKDLATELYLAMVADNTGKNGGQDKEPWSHNKWYLNDKLVESTHSTTFFVSKHQDDSVANYNECATFWYAGRASGDAKPFLLKMEEARTHIDPVINALLRNDPGALARARRSGKRVSRFPLEYDGPWRGNVAAANCYRGSKETVGYHADQLTYLGPYPTIASLSLGVTRQFRLRLTPSPNSTEMPRTYSVELPHNSLLVMHPPCQEHFKHTIPPQRTIDVFRPLGRDGPVHTERINITFRFYRPDFRPKDAQSASAANNGSNLETPVCHCGIPTILRADQCVHASRSRSSLISSNRKGKAAQAAASRGEGLTSPSSDGRAPAIRFFWQCQAGQQNEGKGCHFFKFLDLQGERRGPCLGEAKAASA